MHAGETCAVELSLAGSRRRGSHCAAGRRAARGAMAAVGCEGEGMGRSSREGL